MHILQLNQCFLSATTANGSYNAGDVIALTATTSEPVVAGSNITVTVETGGTDRTATLTAAANGTTLTGNYTVQAGDTSADLSVTSFTIGANTEDLSGNAMTSTALPGGQNLSDNKALVIDTTSPTTTLASATYDHTTGVLVVTGANLDTLGVSNGADVKAQVDWTKFVWDINGDDATTANKTFVVGDITSAVVTNAATLTITLTSDAKAAVLATSGFGGAGGADTLDVAVGFIVDTAGNVASTDALANGVVTLGDSTAPTVSSFTSTKANGTYKAGETINITATMDEAVTAGSTFVATVETGGTDREVTLTAAGAGTTLVGTYTVQAGDTSADLTVASFTAGTVADAVGNAMVGTTVPSSPNNIADASAIVIDTTSPANSGNGTWTDNTSSAISADATDNLVFTFTEAIGNKATVEVFFNIVDTYGVSGTRATTAWTVGDTVFTVTLGVGETYNAATQIIITGVQDVAGNSADVTFSFA